MSKKKNKEIIENKELELIESEMFLDITFICPIRGRVTQKVKGIKYKAQKIPDRQINYEYDFLKEEESDDTIIE
jgi:predicted PP-loop superfamily ATPase